jgi:hypothetical protein
MGQGNELVGEKGKQHSRDGRWRTKVGEQSERRKERRTMTGRRELERSYVRVRNEEKDGVEWACRWRSFERGSLFER